jgi:hypothetical protein
LLWGDDGVAIQLVNGRKDLFVDVKLPAMAASDFGVRVIEPALIVLRSHAH